MAKPSDILARLRAVFLAFPEVTERPSHGAPAWFVRDKRSIGTLWEHGHHEIDRTHMWCAAPPGAQAELIAANPARFFPPPYVGHRGWIGMYLDVSPDWGEVAEVAEDAYRTIAPKTLIAQLDALTNG